MEIFYMPMVGTGRLSAGQAEQYNVVLRGNVTYRVYVRPDRSAVDFDLQVYDENANLVEWDEDPASEAFCIITPKWTGPFKIVVICAAGESGYTVLIDP